MMVATGIVFDQHGDNAAIFGLQPITSSQMKDPCTNADRSNYCYRTPLTWLLGDESPLGQTHKIPQNSTNIPKIGGIRSFYSTRFHQKYLDCQCAHNMIEVREKFQ